MKVKDVDDLSENWHANLVCRLNTCVQIVVSMSGRFFPVTFRGVRTFTYVGTHALHASSHNAIQLRRSGVYFILFYLFIQLYNDIYKFML